MASRAAMERLLRELATAHPDWRRGSNGGIGHYVSFLRKAGAISVQAQRKLGCYVKAANSIAHGKQVGRGRARKIIGQAQFVVSSL